MALTPLYTSEVGPGYAVASAYPSESLGGYATTSAWAGGVMSDLFGRASSVDVEDNRADYRCLFVYNPDPATATAVRIFLDPVTAGGVLALGADPRPLSSVSALSPQAVETPSAYTAPTGVTFTTPASYGSAVVLGNLAQNFGKAVWIRRTPTSSASAAAESCDLVLQSATGVVWTRRVIWDTEEAGAKTNPPVQLEPFTFPPTSTPFIRVYADYMTTGGSRVRWDVDATLQDYGPYVYQLQGSQSGVPAGSDWFDIGPPVLDAAYLIDDTARMWGMSSTLHYRVVLTTASATYTSPTANVYNGALHFRDWLNAREILRKEHLNQREFVGQTGFLLKAKRYGTRCTCKNASTGERNNSSCLTCYGVGIVGGYHAPVPLTFATMDGESAPETVQYNENLGTTRPVAVSGRVLADIPIVREDVWVSAGGDDVRYYFWAVSELCTIQGAPIILQTEMRMAQRSDVVYQFPVTRPANDPRYWRVETTLTL